MSEDAGAARPRPIRPPFDPELESALADLGYPAIIDGSMIAAMRASDPSVPGTFAQDHHLVAENVAVEANGRTVQLTLLRSPEVTGSSRTVPAIYFIHGGGTMGGIAVPGWTRWSSSSSAARSASPWSTRWHPSIPTPPRWRIATRD